MKKQIAILLALVLLVAMCGCSTSIRGEISSDKEPEFSLGVSQNNTYTSKFLGVTASFDEDWMFYSDDEMKDLNSSVLDAMDGDYAEKIKNAEVIYDMYAIRAAAGSSVNVILNNLKLKGLAMTDEAFIETSIKEVQDAFSSMGYEAQCEEGKVTFAGTERAVINITIDMAGSVFYEKQVLIRKGTYIAAVTFGSFDEAEINDLMAAFKAL